MSDWSVLTDGAKAVEWGDLPELFQAAKDRDRLDHGPKHGLRGCHIDRQGEFVIFYSLGRDGETARALLPFDEQRLAWFAAIEAVAAVVHQAVKLSIPLPFPALVAPAAAAVQYRRTVTGELSHTLFRASHTQDAAELDHLLAYALGLDPALDRNRQ